MSENYPDKGPNVEKYAIGQIQRAHAKVATGLDVTCRSDGQTHTPADPDELPADPDELPRLVDVSDFDIDELPLRPWLMEGLLMDGHVTLVAAKGGAGKSLFSMQVAIACASGRRFAYWEASRVPIAGDPGRPATPRIGPKPMKLSL